MKSKAYYRDLARFGGNRTKALERDGYACVNCGMTDTQHKKTWGFSITVDHIDGKGRYSEVKNHSLDNLQTLCVVCHSRKDSVGKSKIGNKDRTGYVKSGTKREDNSSGYRGVSFDKCAKKWKAYIGYKGKKFSIGYFDSAREASRAYEAKVKELY